MAVVVTYHSDLDQVRSLLDELCPQVDSVVVVDNGSDDEVVAALRDTVSDRGEVVALGDNLGIATAQNRGIEAARNRGATHVLLSDDDSAPSAGMVDQLLAALVDDPTGRLGAVGPVVVDERTAQAPLVFTDQGTGPRRIPDLPTTPGTVVDVAFLIASGCLVDLRVVDDVGGMHDGLFIDHVDLEWGLRARARGWRLAVVVGARLDHHLGDATRPVPWRSREVHIQSPVRNYYTVRNTLWLVRGRRMPVRWRWGYLAWITRYIVFYLVTMPPRWVRARLVAQAVADAARNRQGRVPARLVERKAGRRA
ncbi:MAG: glycosyltransferase family 2 protein [Micrococcales bacterium]|nr:glycosyltransferase family 2 protein [Micrococcales bacterium]MCL2668619.1 glycosyltransferase family 2 protein [Micrococcales bacterium]